MSGVRNATPHQTADKEVEGVNPVHPTVCAAPYSSVCAEGHWPIDVEGRAQAGTELPPGGAQTFDLQYNDFSDDGCKAQLTSTIEKTDARLEITIETTSYSKNSTCEVVPSSAGRCTAGRPGHHLPVVTRSPSR